MNLLTAAHRTLQLPSLVRVTNISNNKSIILRVNDRGPFAKDRIIDVSKKAASLLGFQKEGTTQVIVCLLYTSPSPRDQRGSRMPSSA